MIITELSGKKICILGFGSEGQATLRALQSYTSDTKITIADANASLPNDRYPMRTGSEYLQDLESFDIIIKSPGIPPKLEFKKVENKIVSAVEIFLDTVKAAGSIVIGVTGSKGKSTTASLIYAALSSAGKDAHLVGNIGEPVLDHLHTAKPETIFVVEMSSYQLLYCHASPHIAVLTSFFPEHLDYHGSQKKYLEAKTNIARFQNEQDSMIYPSGNEDCSFIAKASCGRKIAYRAEDAVIDIRETKLKGMHNQRNIAAAGVAAALFGVSKDVLRRAFASFAPLPHRLQSLGLHHGIEWVDDAISTTPESTVAALEALGSNVRTLILGGQDRGTDFSPLKHALNETQVKTIILCGANAHKVSQDLSGIPQVFLFANSLEEAVDMAISKTEKGTMCVLSPAAPSYDMFKNFEEKGNRFKALIGK